VTKKDTTKNQGGEEKGIPETKTLRRFVYDVDKALKKLRVSRIQSTRLMCTRDKHILAKTNA
jgi:hypothetical protein